MSRSGRIGADWAKRLDTSVTEGTKNAEPVRRPHQGRRDSRCGELVKQIKKAKPGPKWEAGAHPQLSRTSAARDSGLSTHQAKQAVRVAAVPDGDFERQESARCRPGSLISALSNVCALALFEKLFRTPIHQPSAICCERGPQLRT